MSVRLCRWGILSTATIARKNWQAIRRSGNGRVTAVASRGLDRAAAFIAECQREQPFDVPPAACGSYEELLARDDVDAVYIPLPTGLRKEWVLKAADAGKHVVCEKPCAPSTSDLVEMIEACRRNRVQFMDGVMFMHSARLPQLREVLDDGETIGEIRRVTAQFSFRAPEEFLRGNIRMSSTLEPHGCLGDLGWYTIRFSLWALGYRQPLQVTGRLLAQHGRPDSPDVVPTEFSGELLFEQGTSAGFYCSFLAQHQQWSVVSGARGYVQLDDFVLPFFGNEVAFRSENSVFDVQGCEFRMERHRRTYSIAEYSNSHATAQEANLFRTFGNLVLAGEPDPFWAQIALQTQQVMDACLASARQGGAPVPLGD
jgi:predicted dehydrogenase